jgi:hypothetical protein
MLLPAGTAVISPWSSLEHTGLSARHSYDPLNTTEGLDLLASQYLAGEPKDLSQSDSKAGYRFGFALEGPGRDKSPIFIRRDLQRRPRDRSDTDLTQSSLSGYGLIPELQADRTKP